jgi:hypothetical protein
MHSPRSTPVQDIFGVPAPSLVILSGLAAIEALNPFMFAVTGSKTIR